MQGSEELILLARIEERVEDVCSRVEEIVDALNKDFVKKETFEPVKNTVYGGVGAILLAVVGSLIALVIRKQ